jgi:hypothetical protein
MQGPLQGGGQEKPFILLATVLAGGAGRNARASRPELSQPDYQPNYERKIK